MERKKKAKPRGDSPHPPCRERPPTPQGPLALQPGPTQQSQVLGGTQRAPGINQEGGESPRSSPHPLPLCKNLAPKAAPRPHPSCHCDLQWGRAVATQISPVFRTKMYVFFFLFVL